MSEALTEQEVRDDLAAADQNILRLRNIVQNMAGFIEAAADVGYIFKRDLMKWESLYDDAVRMRRAISEKLEGLSHE